MLKQIPMKLLFFILGVVVGGGVVFGDIHVTETSSNNGNGTSNSTGSRANSSLKYLIVVSRHGNKNTGKDYPLDPYPWNNTHYWPYGSGELTPHGRTQAYNLGVKLRSLYNGFLSTIFSVGDVYACTDVYDRTMMSGELVMAGLYPPEGWQVWNKNVKWQPIPLFTNSSDHSAEIGLNCPRYKKIFAKSYADYLKAEAANISKLANYVHNKTGQTVDDQGLRFMLKKLISEETEGYKVPDWTKAVYPSRLNDLIGKQFIESCASTDEMTRLWMGNFQTELVETLSGVVNRSLTTRRLSYYSAHDVSMLNLQVALGRPRSSIITDIRTGSALVLELHQTSASSEFYVQVLYVNGSSVESDPLILALPDCGDPCYFDSFLNTTKRFINVDYEAECKCNDSSSLDTSLNSLSDKIYFL